MTPYLAQGIRFLVAVALLFATAAAIAAPSQQEVKAVFLYNFAHFIEWPASEARRGHGEFRYCVKDAALAAILREVVGGEAVAGKRMSVAQKFDARSLNECHVLYVDAESLDSAEGHELLRGAAAAGVLSVSDGEGFAEKGGMIGLTHRRGRIHPVINLGISARAGLRISAKLLNLATVIGGRDTP